MLLLHTYVYGWPLYLYIGGDIRTSCKTDAICRSREYLSASTQLSGWIGLGNSVLSLDL